MCPALELSPNCEARDLEGRSLLFLTAFDSKHKFVDKCHASLSALSMQIFCADMSMKYRYSPWKSSGKASSTAGLI